MSLRKIWAQYLGNCLRLPKLERDVTLVTTEDGKRFALERRADLTRFTTEGHMSMLRCSECGQVYSGKVSYCHRCGARFGGGGE